MSAIARVAGPNASLVRVKLSFRTLVNDTELIDRQTKGSGTEYFFWNFGAKFPSSHYPKIFWGPKCPHRRPQRRSHTGQWLTSAHHTAPGTTITEVIRVDRPHHIGPSPPTSGHHPAYGQTRRSSSSSLGHGNSKLASLGTRHQEGVFGLVQASSGEWETSESGRQTTAMIGRAPLLAGCGERTMNCGSMMSAGSILGW